MPRYLCTDSDGRECIVVCTTATLSAGNTDNPYARRAGGPATCRLTTGERVDRVAGGFESADGNETYTIVREL